jgi:enterochelin esterase-like enzyme
MIHLLKGLKKPMYVDCGTEDYLLPANQAFIDLCKKNKIEITWVTSPGKHDRDYWLNAIPKQIAYFAKITSS